MRGAAVLLAILSLAFALRLAVGFVWQARLQEGVDFAFGDSASYWNLADRIAARETYAYGPESARLFRTPGYPALLAPLFLLREQPPIVWGRALSALFTTIAVGGVYWLTTSLFNRRAALVAAGCAALYPGMIALGGLVLSEAPFCALLPIQLVLWTKAWRSSSPVATIAWAFAAGGTAGLASLVRPSWLLFTPFAISLGLLFYRQRKKQLITAVGLMVGLCVAMAPWWIRNARVTGHFVPTTLQVGASLYDGLHPQADGSSRMDFVAAEVAKFDAAQPDISPTEREYALNVYFRQQALDWARGNPGQVARLAATKFTRMWNVWPNEPQFRRLPIRLGVLCTYVPLLVLGVWGAVRYVRRGLPYLLCLLPAVYLTLLHMVFVSSIRYRIPPMLLLIVLGSGVVCSWWRGAEQDDTTTNE